MLFATRPAAAQAPPIMFRGDPAHTGVVESAPFEGQGGVLWRHRTGGAVRSTPAVTASHIYFGSSDGGLYALDRSNGRRLWRFDAGSPVTSSPAVATGLVVAMTRGGRIFAVSERSGRLRWSRQTGAELPFNTYPAGRWDVWASSPVISGSAVVIGGADGVVYALDLATGRTRWTARTGGRVRATPAVADGMVIVGSWDGRVYALDLATGAERWVHRTIGDTLDSKAFGFDRRAMQSSAAIADGGVYVGSRDGGLYALDLRTGERRWRATHRGSWVVGSPAVRAATVWVGSSDGRFIQAVDAATGSERWRFETGANVLSSPCSSPAMVWWDRGQRRALGRPARARRGERHAALAAAIRGGALQFTGGGGQHSLPRHRCRRSARHRRDESLFPAPGRVLRLVPGVRAGC